MNDQEQRIYVVFRGTKTDQQLLFEGWQSLAPKTDFYGVGSVGILIYHFHRKTGFKTRRVL